MHEVFIENGQHNTKGYEMATVVSPSTASDLASLIREAAKFIEDPENRKRLKALAEQVAPLFDVKEVPAEVIEKLEELKGRLHNEPEAAEALQEAINRCRHSRRSDFFRGMAAMGILVFLVGGALALNALAEG